MKCKELSSVTSKTQSGGLGPGKVENLKVGVGSFQNRKSVTRRWLWFSSLMALEPVSPSIFGLLILLCDPLLRLKQGIQHEP